MTPRRWLVTGASGFLGRHLLQSIRNDIPATQVVALVRDVAAWRAMEWTAAAEPVALVTGGVLDTASWERDPALDGLTGIFHLAAVVRHGAQDAALVERTAVDGTLAMVRLAAARRCRLIYVSTSGTVGCFRQPGQSADEDAPYCDDEVAGWPYYRSKIAAERQARALADELGVELVIARPPVLLGPGDHRHRATEHVGRLLHGRLPFVIRGGMHFADVRDVARALVRIMEVPAPRPVYHLPGMVCTIEEFYRLVARAAGLRTPRMVPYPLARTLARVNETLGRPLRLPDPHLVDMAAHHWAVHSRWAKEELGYESRRGEDTVRDTVHWLSAVGGRRLSVDGRQSAVVGQEPRSPAARTDDR